MDKDKTGTTAKGENRKMDRRSVLGIAAAGLARSMLTYSISGESHPTAAPESRRGRFEGKVVVITGATSGIGRAAALKFAAEGAKVSFCGHREKLGHEVENDIKARGGEGVYIRADVRDESQVKALPNRRKIWSGQRSSQ